MYKEKVVGFLVVIIAIPDCKYLLSISMTIKRDMCIYTGNQENPWHMHGHSLSKGIQNNNNWKSFLELLLWGQSWLVYVYRYICIITKEHQWCLWISCQAEELRLLCWANHPLSFGLGQRGLTIEVQWTPQNLKGIKHSCLH